MNTLLQDNTVHVIKIGGENASDPRTSGWLAESHGRGDRIAVAISALRTKPLNTTTELIKASKAYDAGGMKDALSILENLFRVHLETLQEAGMHDERLGDKLRQLFMTYFPADLDFSLPQEQGVIQTSPEVLHTVAVAKEQRFIGYGEVMSAHVLAHLLTTRFQVANNLIDSSIDHLDKDTSLSEILRNDIGNRVQIGLQDGIVIVPGYVSVSGKSILSAYGRGYTDKMAERIAVGLSALGHNPVLHIQKQVPLLSSNPNNIARAKAIPVLSYNSAAEITGARGANAQVLNEHTVSRELSERDIPVHVYNPFVKDAPTSIISRDGSGKSEILFIDGRSHVTAITVSGFGMSGPGLLSRLTEVFTKQHISIDSISSSETEVTLTTYQNMTEFEKSETMRLLHGEIGDEYDIGIKNNLGMIYCIGDNLAGHPGILEKLTGVLADAGIDIECISQSRGQRCVTLGVASEDIKNAVALLHQEIIGD